VLEVTVCESPSVRGAPRSYCVAIATARPWSSSGDLDAEAYSGSTRSNHQAGEIAAEGLRSNRTTESEHVGSRFVKESASCYEQLGDSSMLLP